MGTTALLVALVMAAITTQMTGVMPTPAIPDMTVQLNTTAELVGLAHALVFLVGGLTAVVFASYSDYSEARKLLLGALLVTCLGLVLAALATNIWVLMIARMLQGASGAAFPLALKMLGKALPPRQFGRSVGILTAAYGGLGGIEAVTGGWLTDSYGFRAVFAVITVVAITATLAVALFVPKFPSTATGRMDWPGAAVLCLSLLMIETGLGMASNASLVTVASFIIVGLLFFGVFIVIEKRRTQPLLPVDYLRSRRAWPLLVTSALTLGGLISMINYTLPVLAQDTEGGYGYSATATAILFIVPSGVISMICAPLAGIIAPRVGWRRTLCMSLACSAPLVGVVALVYQSPWVVFTTLLLIAPFSAAALTTVNVLSVTLSPTDNPGVLPGVNTTMFAIGASLGIAIAAQLVAHPLSSSASPTSGFQNALWMSAVAITLALLSAIAISDRTSVHAQKV